MDRLKISITDDQRSIVEARYSESELNQAFYDAGSILAILIKMCGVILKGGAKDPDALTPEEQNAILLTIVSQANYILDMSKITGDEQISVQEISIPKGIVELLKNGGLPNDDS